MFHERIRENERFNHILLHEQKCRDCRKDAKGQLTIRSNIPEIRSKRQSTFSGGNNGSDRKNMILVWSDFLLVLLPKSDHDDDDDDMRGSADISLKSAFQSEANEATALLH